MLIDDEFPVSASMIAQATKKDKILLKVMHYTQYGWCDGKEVNDELKPFYMRRFELSVQQGCLLWGLRVIIPRYYQPCLLKELHSEHPGVCAMKALGRSFIWWPKMDEAIEQLVRQCSVCQNARNLPPKAPLKPGSWPTRPFQRVHIDFCEKGGDKFLVLIDSHSKWVDVKPIHSTTAQSTMDELRLIFAEHGILEILVSDNGPPFQSEEFSKFMKLNGIKHVLMPAYHPASNGAAERTVRVVKEALLKQVIEGCKHKTIKHRMARFLLKYWTTPHSTPTVLLLS